jgi:hypothetical protein
VLLENAVAKGSRLKLVSPPACTEDEFAAYKKVAHTVYFTSVSLMNVGIVKKVLTLYNALMSSACSGRKLEVQHLIDY